MKESNDIHTTMQHMSARSRVGHKHLQISQTVGISGVRQPSALVIQLVHVPAITSSIIKS